jgi:hypothetical protein
MPQWSNSSGSIMRPYRSPWGSPQIRFFAESTCAATATIKAGDIVQNDSVVTTGGLRVRRASFGGGTGANLLDSSVTAPGGFIGVALQTSTSDGSTTGLVQGDVNPSAPVTKGVHVALFDGVTEFLGFFKTSVTAGADIAASSLIGLTRAITYDSTLQVYFLDSTNSTAANVTCIITDIPSGEVGSCGGSPVVFRMLSTNVHRAIRVNPAVTV